MIKSLPGQSFPLGATVRDGGVNFCVFSKNCTEIELLLFDTHDTSSPKHIIKLDPSENKTFYYWHIFVPGLASGQLYAYRVHGPYKPEKGFRFDGGKTLIDPYARAVMYSDNYDRERAKGPWTNTAESMKSVVVAPGFYDWEGDIPLNRPFSESVIYEMHVRGFTKNPNSNIHPNKRGTYAGLIEKIPYLIDLGVTAVELLPVQQFDPQDAPPGLNNYWGYQPIAFFAPHRDYSMDKSPLGPVNEFRDMVKALHKAGIEVIIDVVFNHTAEGDHTGPTLSFRGFENIGYYILEPDQVHYTNYAGTGNTMNGNHSIVRRLIMDCLRYWVREMHIDGFRFDLASVLSRDEQGNPLQNPPILWEIESDPVLAGTKIIAEAWDAAGLYQVGSFIGHRWAEWNGQFRDDVRQFWISTENSTQRLAARILASPDLYPQPDREPNRSINFVTAHDGFTLNDLVSYNKKHNLANGEFNRDGADVNYSWNCGVEGNTNDQTVNALRKRQMKNMMVTLFMSQGTPMFLMGDEVHRTQSGNNNVYCQDNPISWFNWDAVQKNTDMLRFTKNLIRFTQNTEILRQEVFLDNSPTIPPSLQKIFDHINSPENTNGKTPGQISWHGVSVNQPDWGYASHSIAFSLYHPKNEEHLHIIFNAYWEPLIFELPSLPKGRRWYRVLDTNLPSPEDISAPGAEQVVRQKEYTVNSYSAVVLVDKYQ